MRLLVKQGFSSVNACAGVSVSIYLHTHLYTQPRAAVSHETCWKTHSIIEGSH